MNCEIVDWRTYKSVIHKPMTVFHSHDFNNLNRSKCDKLLYFLFKDSKYRGGIVFGELGKQLLSPFSAPYGGFSFLKETNPQMLLQIIDSLKTVCKEKSYERIEITLPPLIYAQNNISKEIHALHYSGFEINVMDINNHIDLAEENEVKNFFNRNARRNFNSSDTEKLYFKKVNSLDDKERVYLTIKKNREQNRYPLKMSFDEILSTSKIVDADFFICQYEDKEIAAALVYHVCQHINQVIYWGHDLEFVGQNPMYFFVYKVLNFYKNKGLKILDIGPSSENGIVNDGLFYFKKSMGCESSIKLKMEYKFDDK